MLQALQLHPIIFDWLLYNLVYFTIFIQPNVYQGQVVYCINAVFR